MSNELGSKYTPTTLPRRPVMQWLVLAGSLTILALAFLLRVEGEREVVVPMLNQSLPPICTFQRLFQMDCPGCGMTRSFISLAKGDMICAWHHNPTAFLLFPIVVAQIPYRIVQLWRFSCGLPFWDSSHLVWICWLLLPILVGQWMFKVL